MIVPLFLKKKQQTYQKLRSYLQIQLVLATKVLKYLIIIANSSLVFTLNVNELYFRKEQDLIKCSRMLKKIVNKLPSFAGMKKL